MTSQNFEKITKIHADYQIKENSDQIGFWFENSKI